MVIKKVLNAPSGSNLHIHILDTNGNAKSIIDIVRAQNISSKKYLICGLKY